MVIVFEMGSFVIAACAIDGGNIEKARKQATPAPARTAPLRNAGPLFIGSSSAILPLFAKHASNALSFSELSSEVIKAVGYDSLRNCKMRACWSNRPIDSSRFQIARVAHSTRYAKSNNVRNR